MNKQPRKKKGERRKRKREREKELLNSLLLNCWWQCGLYADQTQLNCLVNRCVQISIQPQSYSSHSSSYSVKFVIFTLIFSFSVRSVCFNILTFSASLWGIGNLFSLSFWECYISKIFCLTSFHIFFPQRLIVVVIAMVHFHYSNYLL